MSRQSVLDVGVSPNDWSDSVNVFMKRFRGDDSSYTGLAVENIDDIARLNPGKSFCQYGGGTFPFKDDAFDWVFSNAVIEHVGGRKEQVHFLQEMCRVSRHVFFTTPNKYFPVGEPHQYVLSPLVITPLLPMVPGKPAALERKKSVLDEQRIPHRNT